MHESVWGRGLTALNITGVSFLLGRLIITLLFRGRPDVDARCITRCLAFGHLPLSRGRHSDGILRFFVGLGLHDDEQLLVFFVASDLDFHLLIHAL